MPGFPLQRGPTIVPQQMHTRCTKTTTREPCVLSPADHQHLWFRPDRRVRGVGKSVFRLLDGGISQSITKTGQVTCTWTTIHSEIVEGGTLFYNVEAKCGSRPSLNDIDQTPGVNLAIINTMAYYDVTGKQHSYVTCMDKTCSYQIIVTVYYATYLEPFREKLIDFSLLLIFRLGH